MPSPIDKWRLEACNSPPLPILATAECSGGPGLRLRRKLRPRKVESVAPPRRGLSAEASSVRWSQRAHAALPLSAMAHPRHPRCHNTPHHPPRRLRLHRHASRSGEASRRREPERREPERPAQGQRRRAAGTIRPTTARAARSARSTARSTARPAARPAA